MTDENKTERLHMLISPSELNAIDDWGFKNRIRTKAEAVRRLCQIGLEFDANKKAIEKHIDRSIKATGMIVNRLVAAKKKNPDLKEFGRVAAGLVAVLEEQLKLVGALSGTSITSEIMTEGGDVDELMAAAKGYRELLLSEIGKDGGAK